MPFRYDANYRKFCAVYFIDKKENENGRVIRKHIDAQLWNTVSS